MPKRARIKPSNIAEARRKSRKSREAKENPSAVSNPPLWRDFTEVLVPGIAGYGATRVLARILYAITARRWPKAARHVHAAAGVATCVGTALLAHRWDKTAPYQDQLVAGSGIAALQGLASSYLPARYNWLLADPRESDYQILPVPEKTATAAAAATKARRRARRRANPGDFNDDAIDRLVDEANQRAGASTGSSGGGAAAAAADDDEASDEDDGQLDPDLQDELCEDEDDDEENLNTGLFARDVN